MYKIYSVFQRGISLSPIMTENENTANLYWSVIKLKFKEYPRNIIAAYYYENDTLKWYIEE